MDLALVLGGFALLNEGMKKLFFALACFLFVMGCKEKAADGGGSVAGGAEDGVILAVEGEVLPVGKVQVYDYSMGMDGGKVSVKLPDQTSEGTLSMKETKKRKVESIGEGKYRYTMVEERKTERSTMMGQEQPAKETVNPLEGLAVIAEKGAEGTWTAKLESGEATAEMEAELEKIAEELSKDTDAKIYGTARRKVGDEWEVPGSDMMGVKGAEGTVKLKFEGIEDFGGESCAKLTGTLDLSGSPEGEVPEGIKMRMTGDFVVFRSIEHRVDRQNKLTGKMEVSGEMEPQPGMKISMEMEGPLESLGGSKVTDAE
jgi:hypothetical protein